MLRQEEQLSGTARGQVVLLLVDRQCAPSRNLTCHTREHDTLMRIQPDTMLRGMLQVLCSATLLVATSNSASTALTMHNHHRWQVLAS